jgi:hypothetical protein
MQCRAEGESDEEGRRERLTRGSHMSAKERKKKRGSSGGLGCGAKRPAGLVGLVGLAG